MFKRTIRVAALLAAFGTGMGALSVTPAAANGFSVGITIGNGVTVEPVRDLRHRRHHRASRGYCTPRHALRKASRLGIRRAHVVRNNRRAIVIAGRKYRDRAVIRFARDRGCPVLSFRRR